MKEQDCIYSRFTNQPWLSVVKNCRIVKCRHPDAVATAKRFKAKFNFKSGDSMNDVFKNENKDAEEPFQKDIFTGVDGMRLPFDSDLNVTDDECLYRRSRYCNSTCPGYIAYVDNKNVQNNQDNKNERGDV